MKTKFKRGDRVKILPSAERDGILPDDLGKDAIVENSSPCDSMYIKMVTPRPGGNRGWYVNEENIIIVAIPGQQLLFNFMKL